MLDTKNKISREQADQLNSSLPVDFEIFTSQDDFPQLYQWINLFDNNTYLLGLILTIVASFNSVVVIFIRIIEKKTSLAILRAIGMRKTSLYKSFMTLFSPSILLGLVLGNSRVFIFIYSVKVGIDSFRPRHLLYFSRSRILAMDQIYQCQYFDFYSPNSNNLDNFYDFI